MVKKKLNKKYKDTVFRLIFGNNKEELLALYNAVNGSEYTNVDDLEINTLEDAIYVSMRNDVSFVFQEDLSLYEHQSTLCPNLPLRDLFYVADLLQEMTVEMNLYGSRKRIIPTPRFCVFYNGAKDIGNIKEYRLSEMYTKKEDDPQLELVVRIININDGGENEILNSCKTLREYSRFIAMTRENLKVMKPTDAVTKAVNECIEKNILREFLIRNKARVIKMSIYEFDEKRQRKFDREEGECLKMIALTQKKVKKGKSLDNIVEELESTIEEIAPIYDALCQSSPDADPEDILSMLTQ